MTTDELLDDILRREGGYVDHPNDHGSCTNFGITIYALGDWRGTPVTCADVQGMTVAEARAIYTEVYIKRPGFDRIEDDALRALLVDFGVNSGPRAAVRTLQKAIGVKVDGVLGPATIAALKVADASKLFRIVLQGRMYYIADILRRDPTQRVFAAGWLRRLAEFL